MIELNSSDIDWVFSGIGVFVLSTIFALYLHRKKQRIDVTLTKSTSSIKTNFSKIRLSDNTIKLDEEFFPLCSIRNISMKKNDIRTDSQKKNSENSDDVGGAILVGIILLIGFLSCISTILYAGIEYGLSGVGIEGFLTESEQSSYLSNSIAILALIFIIFLLVMLKSIFGGSDEVKKWEWVLRIVISDETTFLIKSNTQKIEYLKSAIENRMKGDIKYGDISFNIYKGGVHEERLVTAIENNLTGYSSNRAPSSCDKSKHILGDWCVNGDGTVTNKKNGLMWIQAPWGMEWNGNTFTGKPIEVSWVEAKDLFGKGEFSGKSEYGRLSMDELHELRHEKGFVNGKCKIEFSGFDDWRLATADEWRTIQFMSDRFDYPSLEFDKRKEYINKLFPHTKVYQKFWTATGKWHPYMCEQEDITGLAGISRLLAKIEIGISKLHRMFDLKKFRDSGYTAWVCDFENNIDEGGHVEYPVMFVRKLDSVKYA